MPIWGLQARTELDDAGLGPERVELMWDLLERVRRMEAEAIARDEAAAPLAVPDQAPGAGDAGAVCPGPLVLCCFSFITASLFPISLVNSRP